MATEGQTHWHEGLFLQPHHLQWMQRDFLNRFSRERSLSWKYPYGVLQMDISDDELNNMRVRFDRLHVVMPSGLEVRVPENADLPSIDIKEALAAGRGVLTISLGVPVWSATQRNTIEKQTEEDWRVKLLYRAKELDRPDENSGENVQTILIRRINARPLIDGDDRSDLEVIPLLRVVQAVGEDMGLPRRDPTYVPPCLVINGSPILREFVRDIASQVLASRNELVLQTTRGGFSVDNLRGVQFEQLLRLRTLNSFAATLESLVLAPSEVAPPGGITPFEIYVMLRQLLAELAALRPDRDPFAVSPYDHDNPFAAFDELSRKIRDLLQGTVEAKFLKASFVNDEAHLCVQAELNDEHLSRPNEYFLAVKTKTDPKELAPFIEDGDRFKLMPPALIDKRVYGVKLQYEPYPPVELPAEIGLNYFRLIRTESARMWERIVREKAVAAKWPGLETSDFVLTMLMTVP